MLHVKIRGNGLRVREVGRLSTVRKVHVAPADKTSVVIDASTGKDPSS